MVHRKGRHTVNIVVKRWGPQKYHSVIGRVVSRSHLREFPQPSLENTLLRFIPCVDTRNVTIYVTIYIYMRYCFI